MASKTGTAAISHLLTPLEQSQFAKTLYHSIWREFGLTAAGQDEASSLTYPGTCREDFHKAVICEQLLMRDFMRNSFMRNKTVSVLENVDSVLSFCNAMYFDTTIKWNYFKRLIRCSAFIAECLLLRPLKGLDLELHKANAIWCSVFRNYFAGKFGVNRGFEGLNRHVEIYIVQLYAPLRVGISRMRNPHDGVHPSILQNIPLMEEPQTDPNEVYREMYHALLFVDSNRSPESPGSSSPSSQNGSGSAEPQSPSSSSNPPGAKSPRLEARPKTDFHVAFKDTLRSMSLLSSSPDTLRVPVQSTVEVIVTPPSPKSSPHTMDSGNPTVDPVVNVENPADPDKEPQATAKPDDAVASTSKSSDNSPPKQAESPESRSKKRSSQVLETLDDSTPSSPKQSKPT